MKKFSLKISCIFMCLLSLFFVGCSNSQVATELDKKGIEITTTMGEMVESETFNEVLNTPFDLTKVKAKDYDTPTRIYSINIPENFVESLITKLSQGENVEEKYNSLPDNLKEQLKSRFTLSSFFITFNSVYSSAESVSLSSVYTAIKYYTGFLASPTAYLYVFETGKPIVVAYEPFGDKQFTAHGCFLFLNNLTSLSSVREIFEPFGCQVQNVK